MNDSTVYVVSGTSKGLGLALATYLSEKETHCLRIGRHADSLGSKGFFKVDLSEFDSAEVSEEIFRRIGAMPWIEEIVLINNAAVLGPVGPALNISPKAIREAMEVNFFAVLELTMAFRKLASRHNLKLKVLNISSGAGIRPIKNWYAYCSSKAALELWTRVVANESDERFKIALYYPGIVDTSMQQEIRSLNPNDFPEVDMFIGYKQEGKLNSASSVAADIFQVLNDPQFGSAISYSMKPETGRRNA